MKIKSSISCDKFSARRTKFQIYLRISEPQPKFCLCEYHNDAQYSNHIAILVDGAFQLAWAGRVYPIVLDIALFAVAGIISRKSSNSLGSPHRPSAVDRFL